LHLRTDQDRSLPVARAETCRLALIVPSPPHKSGSLDRDAANDRASLSEAGAIEVG
jgi:hypothetical protein